MKKLFTLLAFIALFAMVSESNAQLYKKTWSVGFGFDYPRWTSTEVAAGTMNYGVFLGIKRGFSEHLAVRLNAKYSSLKSVWGPTQNLETETSIISGDFDFLYSLVPCEVVNPYVFVGLGGTYTSFDNPIDNVDSFLDYKFNYGFGAEWKIGSKWRFTSELGLNTAASGKADGNYGTNGGGMFGTYTDTYMHFDIGFLYYFNQKDESKLCQLYEGIKLDEMPDPVDYEKIENIVQKYIPREVVKEVVVEKPVESKKDWILVGVNFDFNSARLKSEAYPVLFHAVQVLLQNPKMDVEIVGYTDNIGTAEANKKLSVKRAQVVKDYLMARGVAASRLSVSGMGEDNPIADNKTAAGRAANRRIEFKVK